MAGPFEQRNAGDKARLFAREQRGPLPTGRPALKATEKNRELLLQQFSQWLEGRGLSFGELFSNAYQCVEEINLLLTAYGHDLYRGGRPLNHFSETINAISSLKPQRRTLEGAWDQAYSWVKLEPSIHHTAMPPQVVMAFLSCCLAWGWVRLAGCVALAWGGLVRAGEVLHAKRGELQLPSDVGSTVPFVLLAIPEPKTRYTTARHQCAKLDIPDLVQVTELAFKQLKPSEALWGMSGQTLRSRFRSVLNALQLPTSTYKGVKALDLGSLRPGGATHLLQTTESGGLVMRPGRWASYRVMSVYIQEIAATSYLSILEPEKRKILLELASCFPTFLSKAEAFAQAQVWYTALARKTELSCVYTFTRRWKTEEVVS